MKMPRRFYPARPGGAQAARGERAVAIIVVLVVLAVLAALLIANARTLAHLKAEILFLDKKQQQKFQVQPAPVAPAALPAREPGPPQKQDPAPDRR